MSDMLPLPPRPNLEQYKKLAKDLQHACKSCDAAAIRAWGARWVETLTRLRGIDLTPDARTEIDREAKRIEERWQKFTQRHERRAECRLSDAQFFVALEHGFASWPKFAAHLDGLSRRGSPVSNFEAAVDAIVSGDAAALGRLLRDHPELARARSTRDHRSTLLHYVSANGVEDFRQKTPQNIVDITRLLLDAGADVNAESEAYGGGSTALGLAATSIHPEQAGVQLALLETLLERGASMEKPGLAGNQHSAVRGCLANGQSQAAQFFADRGVGMDLDEAAGVGRLDLVKRFFDENGALKEGGTQKQLESGLMYACGYGHPDVVQFLLERGVNPALRHGRGETPLHWTTFGPQVEIARLLLQHGAPVDVRDSFFKATVLDWALYEWAKAADETRRERDYALVELLIGAGAKFDGQALDEWTIEKARSDPRMRSVLGLDSL